MLRYQRTWVVCTDTLARLSMLIKNLSILLLWPELTVYLLMCRVTSHYIPCEYNYLTYQTIYLTSRSLCCNLSHRLYHDSWGKNPLLYLTLPYAYAWVVLLVYPGKYTWVITCTAIPEFCWSIQFAFTRVLASSQSSHSLQLERIWVRDQVTHAIVQSVSVIHTSWDSITR